jgi:hypothetical protein
MKLKSVAVAVALLAGFAGAQAADLGVIPTSPSFVSTSGLGGVFTAAGVFGDLYSFEIASASTLTTKAFTSLSSFAEIEYTILNSSYDIVAGAGAVFGPALSTKSISLAAGDYFYLVEGIKETAGLSKYRISASVTPVPEPETYALLLAGLGVVGFMAARRKQS